MIVLSEEEWAKILEEFNGIGTPKDVKRFLDSGIITSVRARRRAFL